MTQPVLELRDVHKVYRAGEIETPALRGLSFTVAPGEFTALVGPSGCGKSTALNLAGALDAPTSGTVRVEGHDLSELSASQRAALRRDRIGFVFQAYNLIPVMTAFENAAAVLSLQGLTEREQRARVMPLLDELGLADLADRRPGELSGGQQQRVAVARALAPEPAVVLADEPTANLDSHSWERLVGLMERLNEERGATFLFTTHDPRVQAKARRVLTLVDGVLAEDRAA